MEINLLKIGCIIGFNVCKKVQYKTKNLHNWQRDTCSKMARQRWSCKQCKSGSQGCQGVVHCSLRRECELHNSAICGPTSLSNAKKSFYPPSAATWHYASNKRKVAILQLWELLSLILRVAIMLFYLLRPLKHLLQSFCTHLQTSLSTASG